MNLHGNGPGLYMRGETHDHEGEPRGLKYGGKSKRLGVGKGALLAVE
jgi:hypothetical protein